MNCKNCGVHTGIHPIDKLQRIATTIGNIIFELSALDIADDPAKIELLGRLINVDRGILEVAEELGR